MEDPEGCKERARRQDRVSSWQIVLWILYGKKDMNLCWSLLTKGYCLWQWSITPAIDGHCLYF